MRRRAIVFAALLASSALAAPAPHAVAYADALLGALRHADAGVGALVAPAEQAATRLIRGGKMIIGGPMKGFDVEGNYRAGGLCLLGYYKPDSPLKADDVVLYGYLGAATADEAKEIATARQAGAYVVAFGSTAGAELGADAHFGPRLAGSGETLTLPDGRRAAPLDGAINVANLWAFTAEFISACTRQGKMPTLLQSVMTAGSRERNARVHPHAFHDDLTVPPIAPKRLGHAYYTAQIGHMEFVSRPDQARVLDRAVDMALAAKRGGHRLVVWMFGHYPPSVPGTPGDPGLWDAFEGSVTPATVKAALKPGDVFLHIGYTAMEADIFKAAREAGAKTIAVVAGVPGGGPPPQVDSADLRLDPGWVLGDADVTVPGYDIKVLPPSGIIQTAVFWMIEAETAARLAGVAAPRAAGAPWRG
ncbi:MAG: hypothetical protein HYU66_10020 [Armatimonadetes bacterium]|nr:hypothetical protein [Armatimonadota bacterium]